MTPFLAVPSKTSPPTAAGTSTSVRGTDGSEMVSVAVMSEIGSWLTVSPENFAVTEYTPGEYLPLLTYETVTPVGNVPEMARLFAVPSASYDASEKVTPLMSYFAFAIDQSICTGAVSPPFQMNPGFSVATAV